jgi:hypothetical protein
MIAENYLVERENETQSEMESSDESELSEVSGDSRESVEHLVDGEIAALSLSIPNARI